MSRAPPLSPPRPKSRACGYLLFLNVQVFFGNPKNEKLGAPMHGMLVDVQARAKLPGGQMRGPASNSIDIRVSFL